MTLEWLRVMAGRGSPSRSCLITLQQHAYSAAHHIYIYIYSLDLHFNTCLRTFNIKCSCQQHDQRYHACHTTTRVRAGSHFRHAHSLPTKRGSLVKMATGTRFTPETRNHNAVGEAWSLIPAGKLEGTSIHCQPVAGGK